MNTVDYVLRTAISSRSKFFSRGWGNPETLHRLGAFQNDVLDKRFLRQVYSVLENTDITITKGKTDASVMSYRGKFKSPLNRFVPNALPQECEQVHFQVILPSRWRDKKPVSIHLAGTGDHHFWKRKFFAALPLVKEHGIGSIILQNPFYGGRKPKNQSSSSVNYVSDIYVMGAALLLESVILMLWSKRMGLGPLGLTGISMGGHMASVAATGWLEPLALVPCLSWTSAAPCFTEGVLCHAVDWRVLETQLNEVPEYRTVLRNDLDFKRKLLTHYTNTDYLSELRKEEEDPTSLYSQYNQISSSLSSMVSNIKPLAYIDSQGRKLGSMIAEADLWKYMQSVSVKLPDVDMFRNIISKDNFQPSQETLDYMLTIMDQSTHLSHFNKPHQDSSIIYVCAEHDRYFPRECYNLTPKDVWKDAEIRYVDSGHVMAALYHQKDFRDAIKDSFQHLGCKF